MATPDQRLVSAFDECVARMLRGEPLDSVLARFPDLASTLRPMLEAGALVRRAQPDPREVMAAQERVRFYVQRQLRKPDRSLFAARALMGVAALALVVFAGMLFLSERSLPGDTLYGLKRASENVRAALGGQDFSERRIDETLALMASGRAAEVVFEGHVTAVSESLWAVEGVPLLVDSATVLTPGIGVGDRVEVRARITREGHALALAIILLEKGALPTATPSQIAAPTATGTPTSTTTLTSTPAATATATTSPSPTRAASPTLTPTMTSTPTVRPAQMPSQTATRIPPPVAPPTNAPPPSGNDNGNDNGDDHSGSGNDGGGDHGGDGNDNDDD